MFIRPCYRKKERQATRLLGVGRVVSDRRGPRQRAVAYLGQLDEAGRLGVKRAAEGEGRIGEEQLSLWEDDSPPPEWVEVDTANVRVENHVDFGGPWLALELIRRLQLDDSSKRPFPGARKKCLGRRWRWCW